MQNIVRAGLFLVLTAFLLMGTTYIIQENGVEVGRWTEDDGRDIEEVVAHSTPDRIPQPERETYEPAAPARFEWYEGLRGHDALISAQDKYKQPAALYFYASWCPHCRNFEKEVLYTDKVRQYLSGFAHVRIDVDEQKELVKKYGVDRYPTFLVRFPTGKVNKVRRTQTPETFIKSLKTFGLKK